MMQINNKKTSISKLNKTGSLASRRWSSPSTAWCICFSRVFVFTMPCKHVSRAKDAAQLKEASPGRSRRKAKGSSKAEAAKTASSHRIHTNTDLNPRDYRPWLLSQTFSPRDSCPRARGLRWMVLVAPLARCSSREADKSKGGSPS